VAELTEKQRAALEARRKSFSSTNQPENRGRKPSKLKKWVKEYSVSAEDFTAIFKNIIACKTVEELQTMTEKGNAEKLPIVVVACAMAVADDIQRGRLTWTNTVLDRVMGKPTQQVILGGGDRAELPDDPEERRALAERLRNELGLAGAPESLATGRYNALGGYSVEMRDIGLLHNRPVAFLLVSNPRFYPAFL
jgi:hypothetical protein